MEEYVHVLQRQVQEQQKVNKEQTDHIQRLMDANRQLQQQNTLLTQKCQEAGLSTPVLSAPDGTMTQGVERPGSGGRHSAMMVGGFSNLSAHPFPGTLPYPANPTMSPNRSMGPPVGSVQHRAGVPHPPYNIHPNLQARMGQRDLQSGKPSLPFAVASALNDSPGHAYITMSSDLSPLSNGGPARGTNFGYPFGPCSVPPEGDCKMSGSQAAFSPNPMTGVDPYLDSILNLTGLPTGSGAGYGVGVTDDELLPGPLQLNLSDLGSAPPPGPPSASLLQDWLDMKMLDPKDMDALQKELESGSQDAFLHSLEEL